MQWFRLAAKLGKTVQEVQGGTTSTEFVEWCRFMEIEVNEFHREDYFLAQVAAESRRAVSKHPRQVRVEDFLLRFRTPRTKKPPTLAESMSFWLGSLGFRPES